MKPNALPDAYPLQWPLGWPRTRYRKSSSYRVTEREARDELLGSIKRLGGSLSIISSNVPTNNNGLPYTGVPAPQDPGIAVYWVRDGKQEVMACDRWNKPWENMRAIYHALEGLRMMERAGATQIMERAFQAFALPEGGASGWRDVLGHDVHTKQEATVAWRRLAIELHPDRNGGNDEAFKNLEAAYRTAMKELQV